jgi:hypothetical protein
MATPKHITSIYNQVDQVYKRNLHLVQFFVNICDNHIGLFQTDSNDIMSMFV